MTRSPRQPCKSSPAISCAGNAPGSWLPSAGHRAKRRGEGQGARDELVSSKIRSAISGEIPGPLSAKGSTRSRGGKLGRRFGNALETDLPVYSSTSRRRLMVFLACSLCYHVIT